MLEIARVCRVIIEKLRGIDNLLFVSEQYSSCLHYRGVKPLVHYSLVQHMQKQGKEWAASG